LIAYNLACYECQLGNLPQARDLLREAFKLGDRRPTQTNVPAATPIWNRSARKSNSCKMNPSPDQTSPEVTLFSCRVRRGYGLAFLLVVASLSAGAALERWVLMSGIPASAAGDFRLMAQAWNIIDRYYVDRPAVRHAAMTAGAISGMTESLGDTGHSVYLTAPEARKAGAAVQGKLNGIGVEIIQSTNHQTVVVAPMDGSPAQQAGVRPGDVILEVDGHPVSGMPLSHISARMSGEAGQPVA
jgi:hypothetical protein